MSQFWLTVEQVLKKKTNLKSFGQILILVIYHFSLIFQAFQYSKRFLIISKT